MKRYDEKVLGYLLDRYERSLLYSGKNKVNRAVSMPVSKKTLPEYFDESALQYEVIHQQLEKLETDGYVRLVWKNKKTKTVEYKSDSVQDDLIKYVEYLRTDAGFSLIKEMDLSVVPSTVQLAKESVDEGQVIIIIIDYTLNGYTIKLTKGEGTLTTL